MRQLDLFGMPEEPKEKAEEKSSSAIVVQMEKRSEVKEQEEPVTAKTEQGITNKEQGNLNNEVEEEGEILNKEQGIKNIEGEDEVEIPTIAEKKETTYTLQKPTVIFENEKIGVKIKAAPVSVESEPEKQNGKRGRKSFKEIDAEADLTEVPDDEVLFSKQYYSISQVAQWFKVNNSLIRYWENEFDILKPRKNRKGDRLFRPEDVKNLQLIYHLLRHKKFTIEGAKDYLKANKAKADVNMQIVQSLTKFKSFLLELRANLDA